MKDGRVLLMNNLKPSIIGYHARAIFIRFNRKYYCNKEYNNHGYDWNFIRIGIDTKPFRCEDWYYDGYTYNGITFCFICVGFGYAFDWVGVG